MTSSRPRPREPRLRPLAAGTAGVVAAGVALGVGELVAGIDSQLSSPVEAVATEIIDRAPLSLERFAIETFGHNDKAALVVGILALSAVFGAVLGVVARRRSWLGTAGLAAFALLGVLAAVSIPGRGPEAAFPSLAAGLAGIVALRLLVPPPRPPLPTEPTPVVAPMAATTGASSAPTTQARPSARDRPAVVVGSGGMADRRVFLAVTGAAAVGAALAAWGGRTLRSRFSAAESRAQVRLPRPARPLAAVPAGVEVGVAGVAPFVTRNADFYRVDTALFVPQVRAEDWSLRVTGMVDRPFELTYAELIDRDLVEADVTMTCVSNPVGGDLVGHARWLGVLTRDLLADAGVDRDADQLVGRSVDGYTCGFPLAAVHDRDCLVAVGMNGQPLPLSHGFPARLVTPGIYGYVGSTKWLAELEVTTFEAFDQYWVRRGYATEAPVKTMARIDTPRSLERLAAGPQAVAGVAWAQTRGIAAVEVRVDDGPFQPAELADALNDDSWRQWRFDWEAPPGRHTLTVRAVDGTGAVQTDERADVVPDGASGWMSLVVLVEDPA